MAGIYSQKNVLNVFTSADILLLSCSNSSFPGGSPIPRNALLFIVYKNPELESITLRNFIEFLIHASRQFELQQ
jgi:hypothetical protein